MIQSKIKVPFRKLKHIHHISDIQIRNLKRHKEYEEVFNRLYEKVKVNPENAVAYIGGDIAHSKTEMSPELIDQLSRLFKNLSDICPTIIIAGNHDCNLNNLSRMDCLSPIVENLNHPNLHYLKNTGVYKCADVSFVVWDVWDNEKDYIRAKDVEGNKMKRVAFIQSGTGTLTLLIGSETYNVGVDHPNFGRIMQVLNNRDADELLTLVDVPTSVETYTGGKIKIQEGLFMYDGYELHNALTERIMKLMVAGHSFEYMVKFLDNLMENPSGRAVQELYTFLEHRSLPITEDGCLLAYKSVREDWTDWYSSSIDNSVGKTVSIPRNRVDDNCEKGCSYGLHAGAIDYVSDYHGHDDGANVVIVKINPKDVVSVPTDCDCTKIRVCSYEVTDIYEGDLKEVLYKAEVGNIAEIIGRFDNSMADHWYSYEDYEEGDIDGI